MTRWASNTTWLEFQGTESPQKGAKRARHVVLGVRHVALGLQHDVALPQRHQITQKGSKKKRATSHWECAMSCWASNTTWLEPKGSEPPKKKLKRARHVALGPRYVALDLQRDVAPQLQTPSY